MKRSEINAIIRDSLDFLARMQFHLPPFAHWSPDEWRAKGPECRDVVRQQLGWDITDFGSGDFATVGLFLFTIRNGTMAEAQANVGKTYAEKILIVREGQITPMHFHYHKMEDIINRGGGELQIQVYNSNPDLSLADTPVTLSMDGVTRTVPAGATVVLGHGESVSLPPGLYHEFKGVAGKGWILVGEVSRVNDDTTDNYFYRGAGRFPAIVEDEAPLRLLYGDYARYYTCA